MNPDASDVGTTEFRVCTKPSRAGSACSPEVAHGNSASALDGGTTSWTVDALLADGVYYWQARSWDQAGNHSDWSATQSFTLDAAAPALQQLGTADGVRARVAPHLTATFFDPSPGDKGTVDFELCSDDACTTVVAHGSAAAAASGKTVTWTIPGHLADGTYFFRVRSEDAVQNGSGWTPSRRLVIDTSTPSVPTPSSPADGALTNSAGLTAAFLDPDLDDAGELLFRLCADPGCRIVIASGSTDPVGNGRDASWTPARLRDGHFFWQVAARDAAGNQSAWSDASAFVLDRKPPKTPRRFSGKIVGGKLVLRWSTPDGGAPHAYMLLVDGVKSEVMPGNASSMTIGPFDPSDTRDFTLEAMDAAGNASRPTQSLVAVPNVVGMTLEDASAVLAKRGLVLARQAKKMVAGPAVVIAQHPSVPAVVVKGTHIAVFAANRVGARTRRHR